MIEDQRETPPQEAYVVPLDSVNHHNDAKVDRGNTIFVTTPSAQWAYAAEFPVRTDAGPRLAGRMTVRVEARVKDGSIGIGCIGEDGQFITETEVSRHHASPFVDLLLNEIQSCRSIIIRNTSSSPSQAEISSIIIATLDSEEQSLPEIAVDDSSLRLFTPWSGVTPAGYWTDFLGIRACHQLADFSWGATRAPYWAGESRLPHSAANRHRMVRSRFRRVGFFDS